MSAEGPKPATLTCFFSASREPANREPAKSYTLLTSQLVPPAAGM